MSTDAESLYQAALHLPEAEQLEIAVRLLDKLPPDFPGLHFDDPELLAELDRRSANLEGLIPWSDLRNED